MGLIQVQKSVGPEYIGPTDPSSLGHTLLVGQSWLKTGIDPFEIYSWNFSTRCPSYQHK